jgi:hypothetical protein
MIWLVAERNYSNLHQKSNKRMKKRESLLTLLVRWCRYSVLPAAYFFFALVVNSSTGLLASVPVPSPCPESATKKYLVPGCRFFR